MPQVGTRTVGGAEVEADGDVRVVAAQVHVDTVLLLPDLHEAGVEVEVQRGGARRASTDCEMKASREVDEQIGVARQLLDVVRGVRPT